MQQDIAGQDIGKCLSAALGIDNTQDVVKLTEEVEAVKHPWVTPGSLVQGYGAEQPEPAMLMEPEGPRYGSREELKLSVPLKDLAFAKDLAKRMGWDIE